MRGAELVARKENIKISLPVSLKSEVFKTIYMVDGFPDLSGDIGSFQKNSKKLRYRLISPVDFTNSK